MALVSLRSRAGLVGPRFLLQQAAQTPTLGRPLSYVAWRSLPVNQLCAPSSDGNWSAQRPWTRESTDAKPLSILSDGQCWRLSQPIPFKAPDKLSETVAIRPHECEPTAGLESRQNVPPGVPPTAYRLRMSVGFNGRLVLDKMSQSRMRYPASGCLEVAFRFSPSPCCSTPPLHTHQWPDSDKMSQTGMRPDAHRFHGRPWNQPSTTVRQNVPNTSLIMTVNRRPDAGRTKCVG